MKGGVYRMLTLFAAIFTNKKVTNLPFSGQHKKSIYIFFHGVPQSQQSVIAL